MSKVIGTKVSSDSNKIVVGGQIGWMGDEKAHTGFLEYLDDYKHTLDTGDSFAFTFFAQQRVCSATDSYPPERVETLMLSDLSQFEVVYGNINDFEKEEMAFISFAAGEFTELLEIYLIDVFDYSGVGFLFPKLDYNDHLRITAVCDEYFQNANQKELPYLPLSPENIDRELFSPVVVMRRRGTADA